MNNGVNREERIQKGDKRSRKYEKTGKVVGVAGFEPATPSSRTKCATKLRHTPINGRYYTDPLFFYQPSGDKSASVKLLRES